MKTIIRFLLVAVVAVSLSSCASKNGKNLPNEGISTPKNFQVIPTVTGVSSNKDVLRNKISEDLESMEFPALRAVNNFINSSREAWVDPNLSVLVMTVNKGVFPVFLEGIMNSGKFKGLPRSKSSLIKLRNEDVPEVENLFIAVPVKYMQEGDDIFSWMPNMEDWVKAVDLEANKLAHLSPEHAFLKIFWMANKVKNPKLFANLKKNKNDWNKLPQLKDIIEEEVYFPIWTLR